MFILNMITVIGLTVSEIIDVNGHSGQVSVGLLLKLNVWPALAEVCAVGVLVVYLL